MSNHRPPIDPTVLPKSFNFAIDIVDYWARTLPSQTALHWVDQSLQTERKLTYLHFSQRSHRIAAYLTSIGVKPGDTCVVILPRLPEWWEIATACVRAGIILCPCTTLLVAKDIEYRLNASRAKVFIGDSSSVAKAIKVRNNCPDLRFVLQVGNSSDGTSQGARLLEQELANVSSKATFKTPKSLKPTSPALVFFTSGTTGLPKMVLHSQVSYPLAHTLTGLHWLQLTSSSVYWNLSEQGWAKAAWSFFATWDCGATLFVHDDRQAFSANRTLTVLSKFPITTLCAPPTVYRQLILDANKSFFQGGRIGKLKHACGAGEPLNAGVIEKWKQLTGGMEIFDGYGQTETILLCANQAGNRVKPGSMGKPIPGVPLMVIGPEGEVSRNGDEGDIAVQVKSDAHAFFGMFQGYINQTTNKLDRRVKRFSNGKEYYLTGDRAFRDSDGYFHFVGRSDDVINSSGYRIGPFEVESTLKLHPAVVESAVVASPDPQRDEVVKAFIVLTDEASSKISKSSANADKLVKELQDFCKENAAPYKYPRKVEFVDASFLPKTISGKIKRAELKKMEKQKYAKSSKANL